MTTRQFAAALLAALCAFGATAQTVSITSTPANGTHYVAGEAITTRISGLSSAVLTVGGLFSACRMSLTIGENTREASTVRTLSHPTETFVDFTYTVVAADLDTDGISIPANSISGPTWGAGGGSTIDRNHAALSDQVSHKVGSAVPAVPIVTDTASLALNEGASATYTVALGSLPAGTVTVSITSDNSDVTVDTSTTSGVQTTLTFTTTNWTPRRRSPPPQAATRASATKRPPSRTPLAVPTSAPTPCASPCRTTRRPARTTTPTKTA